MCCAASSHCGGDAGEEEVPRKQIAVEVAARGRDCAAADRLVPRVTGRARAAEALREETTSAGPRSSISKVEPYSAGQAQRWGTVVQRVGAVTWLSGMRFPAVSVNHPHVTSGW